MLFAKLIRQGLHHNTKQRLRSALAHQNPSIASKLLLDRPDGKSDEGNASVDEDGWYTSKEEVALYIHLYGDLPDNYVTKDEAEDRKSVV